MPTGIHALTDGMTSIKLTNSSMQSVTMHRKDIVADTELIGSDQISAIDTVQLQKEVHKQRNCKLPIAKQYPQQGKEN